MFNKLLKWLRITQEPRAPRDIERRINPETKNAEFRYVGDHFWQIANEGGQNGTN